ncbi:MAG: hypothetical protein WC495_05000 [Patescibacteria group bacterium]|jgi:hypothetical protein
MNILMLGLIVGMGVYILYLRAVIAGKTDALKVIKLLYVKMCNRVFVEYGISKALELRKGVEAEVLKEMGLNTLREN